MSRTGDVWRWLAAALIAALVLLGAERPVAAQADLLTANPTADSVLDVPPGEIVLTFTEPVDLAQEAIRFVTADGTPVELGPIAQDLGSDSLTAVIPGALDDGRLRGGLVRGLRDSHPIRGAHVFSVGAPSAGADDLISDVRGDTNTGTGRSTWLTVGRFASYTGIAALVGTAAAAVILARPYCNADASQVSYSLPAIWPWLARSR